MSADIVWPRCLWVKWTALYESMPFRLWSGEGFMWIFGIITFLYNFFPLLKAFVFFCSFFCSARSQLWPNCYWLGVATINRNRPVALMGKLMLMTVNSIVRGLRIMVILLFSSETSVVQVVWIKTVFRTPSFAWWGMLTWEVRSNATFLDLIIINSIKWLV